MLYQITIDKKVEKQLPKLPDYIQNRFQKEVDEIANDPYLGKPLKYKFKEHFSWRVGDYRIIYKINENEKSVFIELIGHRKNIYEIIRRLLAILFSI
jgi:mRNA interferase RelE/StbE